MITQQVTVLGSTGSIGVSTLDVLARHPQRWRVFALTADTNDSAMVQQCRTFNPRIAVMNDPAAARRLEQALRGERVRTEVLAGKEGLREVAAHPEVDTVMAAIVGAAGLEPSLAAAQHGKKILLANKESLVMSGRLFMQACNRSGASLLPIDSEHNAIFQCMPSGYASGAMAAGVDKILLTASGGPFREWSIDAMREVTPEQACAHPNWSMGRKISVDSASMMNKGLELIEAVWLFNTSVDNVEIVIHPQSVIHSLVQYNDGSVLAQLGNPDMRTPIAHGLAWPDRIDSGVEPLDLALIAQLSFEKPDFGRFPCLQLAADAASAGGSFSCVLNAANEVAVSAFLDNKLPFTAIPKLIESTLHLGGSTELNSIEEVKALDFEARQVAAQYLQNKAHSP